MTGKALLAILLLAYLATSIEAKVGESKCPPDKKDIKPLEDHLSKRMTDIADCLPGTKDEHVLYAKDEVIKSVFVDVLFKPCPQIFNYEKEIKPHVDKICKACNKKEDLSKKPPQDKFKSCATGKVLSLMLSHSAKATECCKCFNKNILKKLAEIIKRIDEHIDGFIKKYCPKK